MKNSTLKLKKQVVLKLNSGKNSSSVAANKKRTVTYTETIL